MNNYKGIYFERALEKYTCPKTGAHFRFEDLWRIMDHIRKKRGKTNCNELSEFNKK
jgi:hypothetical protein